MIILLVGCTAWGGMIHKVGSRVVVALDYKYIESVGLRPLGALNGAFNTYSHVYYMVDLDEVHVGVRAGSIRWVGTGPIQMYLLDPPFWYANRFRVAVRIAW